MMRIPLVALLAAGLLACAGEPELDRPQLGPTPEKLMLAALSRVKASDAQRLAVLNAYDSRNGRLAELARQSRQLVAQWRKLDRAAPDFEQQADGLATQWADINGAEMRARAGYEHALATQLTPQQWQEWQDYLRSVAEAQRRAELSSEGYGARGPR